MAYNVSDDFRRPVPLALAAVAILGWLLVAYFSSQVSAVQNDMHDALNRAEQAREGMAADLQNLQKSVRQPRRGAENRPRTRKSRFPRRPPRAPRCRTN